jgi:ADP-ribose pyrophosphatase
MSLHVTSSRVVYENRWITVREDQTVLPDGTPGLYAVVDKAPAAVILPLDDDDHIWLVEQYRHPVGARFWELPGGAWDYDSDGEAVARGELAEETGLRAESMELLGTLFFAYGMSSQRFGVWLATGLTPGEQALEVTEQGLRVERFPVGDVEGMIRSGEIADGATVAALGLWRLQRR